VRQAYGQHLWTTPGGRVEENESPVAALKREVSEEIGCEAAVVRLLGVYSKPYRNDIVLSFETTLLSGSPHCADAEICDLGFFHRGELPCDMAANSRARVLDAFGKRAPVLRVFQSDSSDGVLWPESTA
jgi:ADP-ribose pyrophosphatase YjhB (NUDIX family)